MQKYSRSSSFSRQRYVISGFINLNVTDGSAFFLAGLTAMCAHQPWIEVFLLSAKPITRSFVTDELRHFDNVKVISPGDGSPLARFAECDTGESLSRVKYADFVAKVSDEVDANMIFVRDTEVGYWIAERHQELRRKLNVYLTGVASLTESPSIDVIRFIGRLAKENVTLLLQTEEMRKRLFELVPNVSSTAVGLLPPHIPDSPRSFEELYQPSTTSLKLAYAGKFFYQWNTDRMFAAVKALVVGEKLPIQMRVAGDQFRAAGEDPYFVENTKYLMKSLPGLKWYGALPREWSRKLIMNCDVGLSWRRPSLNDSTELSSKVLEYGSLGKPVILNPTAAHKRIFGSDYPLFAESMTEFKCLLRDIVGGKIALKDPAQRCFSVAKSHWYSSVFPVFVKSISTSQAPNPNYRSIVIGPRMVPPEDVQITDKVVWYVEGPRLHFVVDPEAKERLSDAIEICVAEYLRRSSRVSSDDTLGSSDGELEAYNKLDNCNLTTGVTPVGSGGNPSNAKGRAKAFARRTLKQMERHRWGGYFARCLRRFYKATLGK